nr:RHS repeat-associated core domain-containing protein [uncultured Flavobacterium sp.]
MYSYDGTSHPNAVTSVAKMNQEYVDSQYFYSYDANGNMTREFLDFEGENNTTGAHLIKAMYWDEQNRLLGVYNDGNLSNHFYDDAGERKLKAVVSQVNISENGEVTSNSYSTIGYNYYPSGNFVVTPKNYTKHYYMGSKRIASRIGNLTDNFNFNFTDNNENVDQAFVAQNAIVNNIYDNLNIDIEYDAYPLDETESGLTEDECYQIIEQGFNYYRDLKYSDHAYCMDFFKMAKEKWNVDTNEEYDTYCEVLQNASDQAKNTCFTLPLPVTKTWWYHTDHLGSSSYLTDSNGKVSHYYNYLPFGELFNEQNNSIYENVYKFNAKELDDASGLYYYSARYYDPKLSIFLSVDPLAEETMTPYQYVNNNPINMVDPTGMSAEWRPDEDGNLIAEKDDNTTTLAKFLSTTTQDVSDRFKLNSTGENLPKDYKFYEGDKVRLNNRLTRSISETDDGDGSYNCFGSVREYVTTTKELKGNAINAGGLLFDNDREKDKLTNNKLTYINTFKDAKFGETVILFPEDGHAAIYYGSDNKGNKYFYSKNGTDKPEITTLSKMQKMTNFPDNYKLFNIKK